MNRLVGLFLSGLSVLCLTWACSTPLPSDSGDDDDDDDDNGGRGGSSGQGQGGASGSTSGGKANGGSSGAQTCASPLTTCGTSCVNTSTDSAHCGNCATACTASQTCTAGVCACATGLLQCSGACTNTQTSSTNCGACGTVCPSTAPFCSAGACAATCGTGLTACTNSCVNTATDQANCGACNLACASGQTCNAGACACAPGNEFCAASSSCVPTGTCGGGVGGASGAGGTPGVGGASGAGGTSGAGGSSGASGSGGSSGTGNNTAPPGYWTWENWHGCSWTGVGTDGASTITPQDFVAKPAADAYCVSGTVGAEPEYKSVALMGFNVAEPPPATCAYKPVDVTAPGPPSVVPTDLGIALDFVKRGANTGFTLRVQLQGPNGHKAGAEGENDRWCATITEVQGKVFVNYDAFTPKCWEMTAALRGTPYAKQPISAVVFLVPGAPTATPYDFCINGVAYGDMASDAPDGPATGGNQMGTVGGSNNDDLDFDRKKVNVGGENYIIQNNNWGNPGGSDCIMSYLNNSFTVTTCNGSGSSAPAAFPSIYQGNNGNTANGVLSTKSTDAMPIQISNIGSVSTTFRYSGGSGSYNATYDIWFANSPPSGEYQDGINGFAMVWLRDPGDKQPIGSQMGSATIGGQSWNIWVGPRGDGPNGYNSAPVVSFVNPSQDDNSRAQSFVNKNLGEFIQAATTVSGGLNANMYLTDIFAGFEIWNGGVGLKVDEFKAVVAPK